MTTQFYAGGADKHGAKIPERSFPGLERAGDGSHAKGVCGMGTGKTRFVVAIGPPLWNKSFGCLPKEQASRYRFQRPEPALLLALARLQQGNNHSYRQESDIGAIYQVGGAFSFHA